jgi:hypothetical protein
MATLLFQGPGFHMDVPSDWMITSSPQFQVMFVAPPGPSGRANLAISIRPVKDGTTVQEVAAAALKMEQRDYAEFRVEAEGELPGTGGLGYQRSYRWLNERNKTRVYQKMVLFLVKGMLTTITATREDSEPAKALDAAFEGMISSFAFD